jgi:hypothetical protein
MLFTDDLAAADDQQCGVESESVVVIDIANKTLASFAVKL